MWAQPMMTAELRHAYPGIPLCLWSVWCCQSSQLHRPHARGSRLSLAQKSVLLWPPPRLPDFKSNQLIKFKLLHVVIKLSLKKAQFKAQFKNRNNHV